MAFLKDKVRVVALLFVGALLVYCYWATKKLNDERDRSSALENTIYNLDETLDEFKVTLNDTVKYYAAKVEDLTYTRKNLEGQYAELLKATNLKPKYVDKVTTAGLVIRDSIREIPVLVDSFGGLRTIYRDDYTSISVNISKERKADINYIIHDSLTIFNTQKKHSILFGLIKWKETKKTVVVSHNPNSRIASFRTINVIE